MTSQPDNEPIDNPVGDDVIVGSSSAFLWDEGWEEPHPAREPEFKDISDDVHIDVVVFAGREPRTVELCFDWIGLQLGSHKTIFDQEGCEYDCPAIPLQFTPENAIQLGKLLIEAGERSKK